MTTQTMTLRLARRTDAAAIARIYTQGIADRIATFETEPRTAEQLEAVLRKRGDAYPTVVAEREGAVIAWAGAAPYSDRPCYAGIGACSVYVEREHRGSGAGRLVLTELIRVYEELGFWKLTSRIFPENAANAGSAPRADDR